MPPLCCVADFNFWQLSPVDKLGWAVLGEASSKWVGVSNKRIVEMRATDDSAGPQLRVRGAPMEIVEFLFFNVHQQRHLTRTCSLSADGMATISAAAPGCGV